MNFNTFNKKSTKSCDSAEMIGKLSIIQRCGSVPLPMHNRVTGRNTAPLQGTVHFPVFRKIGMVNFRQKYRGR